MKAIESGAAAPKPHVRELRALVEENLHRCIHLALRESNSNQLRLLLLRASRLSDVLQVLELGEVPTLELIREVARA